MSNFSMTAKKLAFHLKGRNLKKVPALVGLTGIGKTAVINQVVKEMGAKLIDFNVAQLQEGELGIPVPMNVSSDDYAANMIHYNLNYRLREVFNNPDDDYIIFFDEFTRGTIPVISELMTFVNDRVYQGYKLHDRVRFVVAMNPSTSMYGFADEEYAATEMDDAHANRFTFMNMVADVHDWLKWAENEGNIHPFIIHFLKDPTNQNYFYSKEQSGVRMRTPRSWHYLSDSFHDMEEQGLIDDDAFLYETIADQIGYDIVGTVHAYIRQMLDTLKPEKIFGKKRLTKSEVKVFAKKSETEKVMTLDKALAYLKQNVKEMDVTYDMIHNFTDLYVELESTDNQDRIAIDIANDFIQIDDADTNSSGLRTVHMFYDDEQENPQNVRFTDIVDEIQKSVGRKHTD